MGCLGVLYTLTLFLKKLVPWVLCYIGFLLHDVNIFDAKICFANEESRITIWSPSIQIKSISKVPCGLDSRGMDSAVFLWTGMSFLRLTVEALHPTTSSQPHSHPHTSTYPLTLSFSCASGCSLIQSIFRSDYTSGILLRNAFSLNKSAHSWRVPLLLPKCSPPAHHLDCPPSPSQ